MSARWAQLRGRDDRRGGLCLGPGSKPQGTARRHRSLGPPSLDADLADIRSLIETHLRYTASPVAELILDDWNRQQGAFWVISASAPPRKPVGLEVTEVPAAGCAAR